jgi:phosphoadenosine phosphosulfate reductase
MIENSGVDFDPGRVQTSLHRYGDPERRSCPRKRSIRFIDPFISFSPDLLKSFVETMYILQEYSPSSAEYFLAFSGGKDSVVLKALCDMACIPYTMYFSVTSIDPPQLLSFIKKEFPDVIWLYPQKSMFQLIRHKQELPLAIKRWCCSKLKEFAGKGRRVLLGVRAEESPQRKKRGVISIQPRKRRRGRPRQKEFVNPIYFWTEKDIWEFTEILELPVCELYDYPTINRIGCVGCPLPGTRTRVEEFKLFPQFIHGYLHAIKMIMEKGRYQDFSGVIDVFNWWLARKKKAVYFKEREKHKYFQEIFPFIPEASQRGIIKLLEENNVNSIN